MGLSDRIDLNGLVIFAALAEAGGFTAAADRLGIAKAKVSTEISRLEAQLGISLVSRTTRRVALTEAGHTLYAECVPRLRGIEEALTQLGSPAAELSGTLRIGCTVDHAVQALGRVVAEFAAQHPRLHIDLRTSDQVVDLVEEGLDVSFRMGWLRDSSLRAVKLADFAQYIVAAPDYLARAGLPQRPEELARHEWVALTLLPTPLTWTFTNADGESCSVRTRSHLRADSAAALRALLEGGAGISALDQFSAKPAIDSGRLVRVLPDWSPSGGGLYAVYAPGRHQPARVRKFVDFYRNRLQQRLEQCFGNCPASAAA
ncbi:LysR family transcriptional regulator [Aromatoleum toluvorans]|uniref:LysR family transcriptional regulator n=1 Tax=Aromatoleum toluvorans TaxID=92002 RepID=A0ABX1Q7A6_9RHOO|nr:LysR family transcriptional regulator [Aromatoleum toluvorans]NMG46355.1 LysR family transcriptional regulator [Aromatoleum toluvorans]